MKRVSDKRKIENAQRKVLMLERFGPREEWKCSMNGIWTIAQGVQVGKCHGAVNGHELLKRSRGGSIIDMDNVTLLCDGHNSWVEDHPIEAHRLGLAFHSWEAS